jgi:hypothetical protein
VDTQTQLKALTEGIKGVDSNHSEKREEQGKKLEKFTKDNIRESE